MLLERPGILLERNRDALRAALAREGVDAVGVFGSVARGDDTVDSDLDVVVRFLPGIKHDVIRLSEMIEQLVGARADVVDMDELLAHFARTGLGRSILTETQPL